MPLNSRSLDCKYSMVIPALAVFFYFAGAPSVKADQENHNQKSADSNSFFVQDGSHRRHSSKEKLFAQAKENEGAPGEPAPEGHGPGSELPPPGAGGFPRSGRHWDHFGPGPLDLTPLNLTPEQKQKIQEIRKQTGLKTRNLRKLLKEKRGEMRDAMFDPTITDAQLREKHKAVSRLHQKAEEAMFDDFLSIRGLLTPEQKKHLPEVKPPLREPGGEGFRPGPGRPPEPKGRTPD